MAKYKQRRRKLRPSVVFRLKKQESILPPQCSSILPPKLPVSALNQSGPFCSWALTLPNLKTVLRPLVATVLCWYCWCQNKVIQFPLFFRVIRNAVFRSRVSLEELNTLRERLEKLETEFATLQSTVQETVVALEKTSCSPTLTDGQCQCSMQAPLRLVELPSSQHSQTLMLPAAPPPPPPPLPPPPPPPPMPRGLSETEGAKKQVQDASLKTDVPMQITIKDLLGVKLKKTQSGLKVQKKGSPLQKRRALITISDLQSISLKSKAAIPLNCSADGSGTPSRSGLDFRKHLRRVSIKRSPGGTPLIRKENLETGTGLTPLMTQALRRKFQLAHPKSPSPSHLPRGSSFEEPS